MRPGFSDRQDAPDTESRLPPEIGLYRCGRRALGLTVPTVDRLVHAFTRDADHTPVPDLVCDPFLGGGTTALMAMLRSLRFLGVDHNPAALAFTAQRLSSRRLTDT
jgi:hypothetical protein